VYTDFEILQVKVQVPIISFRHTGFFGTQGWMLIMCPSQFHTPRPHYLPKSLQEKRDLKKDYLRYT